MNCRRFHELMDRLDTASDPARLDALLAAPEWRQHLSTCDSCRQAVAEVIRPLADMGSLEPPEPPADLKNRILRQMRGERSVLSGLRPVITTLTICLIFLAGYWFRGTVDPDASTAVSGNPNTLETYMFEIGSPDRLNTCLSETVWPIDPAALYRKTPVQKTTHALQLAGAADIQLPTHLVAHGPYRLNSEQIRVDGTDACIPFIAPMGDAVMLQVSRTETTGKVPGYVIQKDPRKVMYYTIVWEQGGWMCRIAGRVPAEYLLDLARELTVSV